MMRLQSGVLKVMVVDASKATFHVIGEVFGHGQLIHAVDGFEALAKIFDNCPDIIFIDTDVGRLNGYRLCSLIRRNRRFRATPIFLLSSRNGLFDKARGHVVGADGFLIKPLESVDRIKQQMKTYFLDSTSFDRVCGQGLP